MRLLLGVSGGIAAYKALELTRLAMKAGHSVRVIQTESSTRFVGTASFAGITGQPVLITEFEQPIAHLQLVEEADVFLVAPCTANTLAKLAAGMADNLLTAAALACRKPLVLAPAMNDAMWEHPATQDNVLRVRARGTTVLEPGVGSLGSPGEWGVGRLPEPAELLRAVEAAAGPRDLDGLDVLVTAGGTREPIDSVRYVGNRSSGRMGFALADEAARRGASVTVVAANVALPRSAGIEYVDVETAGQLHDACAAAFETSDVLLMAAAVADYRPARAHAGKLKKDTTGDALRLELERTIDVLSALSARRRPGQLLVGFAAEHGDGALEYGRSKLERKRLDAVVVNDVSKPGIAFDAAENEVTVVTADGDHALARAGKHDIANAILDIILRLRSSTAVRVTQ